jgi:ribosomal protein S18 acetylase RimI-like enzyme
VVHPVFFYKGLGSQLMQYALDSFDFKIFTVETGLKNIPAIFLYRKLGFKKQSIFDTSIGIKKIKFHVSKK